MFFFITELFSRTSYMLLAIRSHGNDVLVSTTEKWKLLSGPIISTYRIDPESRYGPNATVSG